MKENLIPLDIFFFLQQSAELCIKHCMEVAGIRYEHTCVIEDFLDRCDDSCNYTEDFTILYQPLQKWSLKLVI